MQFTAEYNIILSNRRINWRVIFDECNSYLDLFDWLGSAYIFISDSGYRPLYIGQSALTVHGITW